MATNNIDSFSLPSREYRLLKKHFERLLRAIPDPVLFLGMPMPISESARMEITTKYQRRSIRNYCLLNELMTVVTLEPGYFSNIISMLQKGPTLLSNIAKEMKREYGKNTPQYYYNIKKY